MVRSIPLTGVCGEDFYREEIESMQGYYLIGCGLRDCFLWKSLVSCLWLVVLRFRFLNLEAFTGLHFGLLTLAAKVLEPPQANDLLV